MRKHIGMVHYEEELYKYYCHMCGDLFLKGAYLTKHLRAKHNFHKPSGLKRFRLLFLFFTDIILKYLFLFNLSICV